MALFSDGNPSVVADLTLYESSIADTATTEGIDLVAKGSVAAFEIGLELQRYLATASSAATWTLANIAITDHLKHWHVLRTLAGVYRDAYFQQLNDRYQPKWKEYQSLAAEAGRMLLESGLGIVTNPLPRPAAPAVTQEPGTQPARTYYVRVSWVAANGAEGAVSDTTSLTAQDGYVPVVTPAAAPPGANGWNVYIGFSEDTVEQQNPSPIPLGEAWKLSGTGLTPGKQPGSGQAADLLLRQVRYLPRG